MQLLQSLLPPIIAESLLIALAKGSPSSIGPEWSAAEKKESDRQIEGFSRNSHMVTAHVQYGTVAVVWVPKHAKNNDIDDTLQR